MVGLSLTRLSLPLYLCLPPAGAARPKLSSRWGSLVCVLPAILVQLESLPSSHWAAANPTHVPRIDNNIEKQWLQVAALTHGNRRFTHYVTVSPLFLYSPAIRPHRAVALAGPHEWWYVHNPMQSRDTWLFL
ncbi:hypothetical protein FA13DRAFT_1799231 [Coprinellus micaceus]|uniref:Secreted protein n=1 Tax=Coprinellus micaceus TaxID=71717 RepID=A0A4Y7SKE3_COPMI|nr:hypothetical protein FA13DRAFT_1799231 [Coprinellus micaceus]